MCGGAPSRDRPRQGVLEAGRDAEGPVAARGLVRGPHGRSLVGGMERGARKATEASPRPQGEGLEPARTPATEEGSLAGMYADASERTPAAGEVDRAGMFAAPPASRSAAGGRRLWRRFFISDGVLSF